MREMREPELASNRSAAEWRAPWLIRADVRVGSRVQAQSPSSRRSGVPIGAEFSEVDREGYAWVACGIQLAVTPRGARATHGVGRLNEETA
jgi:hypothetical protein